MPWAISVNDALMRWLRRVWLGGPPESGDATGPASAYPLAQRERTLIEGATQGMILYQVRGACVLVNQTALEVLGR